MTTIKLLSAGLITTAMLASPAMARMSRVTSRHLAEDANANASPTARYIDGRVGIPAPRVGAISTAPPDGENCDVGNRWGIFVTQKVFPEYNFNLLVVPSTA